MKLYLKILLFITALVIGACKKYGKTLGSEDILRYTGNLASDRCDWEIQFGDKWYPPESLNDSDKKDNAKIKISYKLTNDHYQCGMVPLSASNPGIPVIKIQKITFTN